MRVTVLGCGTSSGVPLIGCKCRVCRSKNPKNKRLRASIWIRSAQGSVLIDCSSDFRQQALKERISRVDAVLFTHPHTDHIQGVDDLRAYNFIQKEKIPIYGNHWTLTDLKRRYPYIFLSGKVEGGAVAKLTPKKIVNRKKIRIKDLHFEPIPVKHGSKMVNGFRIGSFAYITDCHEIPKKSRQRLLGLNCLILDCVRIRPHSTHLHLEESLRVISELSPKRAYLTHMGHDFDYKTWQNRLPKGVRLAYDGLKIRL